MELGIAAERVRGDFCALRKNRRKLSEACDDVVLQRRFELRLLPHFVRKSERDLKPVGSLQTQQPPTMASVRSS